ncbi:MAG: hypothetical protein IJC18_04355 [Clostridia bacterium]|nr:hypothetical protein [Clostridia bacterium]
MQISRAAGGLIAIKTGAGTHSVELRYRPADTDAALIISLVSLFAALMFIFIMELSRRRREEAQRQMLAQTAMYDAVNAGFEEPVVTDEVSYYMEQYGNYFPTVPEEYEPEEAFGDPYYDEDELM